MKRPFKIKERPELRKKIKEYKHTVWLWDYLSFYNDGSWETHPTGTILARAIYKIRIDEFYTNGRSGGSLNKRITEVLDSIEAQLSKRRRRRKV